MFDSSIDLSKLYRECIACPKVKQNVVGFHTLPIGRSYEFYIMRSNQENILCSLYTFDVTFGSVETTVDCN